MSKIRKISEKVSERNSIPHILPSIMEYVDGLLGKNTEPTEDGIEMNRLEYLTKYKTKEDLLEVFNKLDSFKESLGNIAKKEYSFILNEDDIEFINFVLNNVRCNVLNQVNLYRFSTIEFDFLFESLLSKIEPAIVSYKKCKVGEMVPTEVRLSLIDARNIVDIYSEVVFFNVKNDNNDPHKGNVRYKEVKMFNSLYDKATLPKKVNELISKKDFEQANLVLNKIHSINKVLDIGFISLAIEEENQKTN